MRNAIEQLSPSLPGRLTMSRTALASAGWKWTVDSAIRVGAGEAGRRLTPGPSDPARAGAAVDHPAAGQGDGGGLVQAEAEHLAGLGVQVAAQPAEHQIAA